MRLIFICAALWAALATATFAELTTTRAPIGWAEFCQLEHNHADCFPDSLEPVNAALTDASFRDLVRINNWVNEHIKPLPDTEHWGVVELWSYPEDGYGDCEDIVLLKRRILMQAGWPRQALLITVVRNEHGEGHAVLEVRTDQGAYILDNTRSEVLRWEDTNFPVFVKQQSQHHPNTWVDIRFRRIPRMVELPLDD